MVIKIKANQLLQFIKKVTADKEIEDCKLDFQKDGLVMSHKNLQGTIFIRGKLNKDVFEEYEQLQVNIKNTETLFKVLTSFGDNLINIVAQDNYVKFMDSSGDITLSMAEDIMCYKDSSVDIEYDNSFIVKKDLLTSIIKRNNIIQADEVKISIKDKKVFLDIGEHIDKAQVYSNITSDKEKSALFEMNIFEKLVTNMDDIVDVSLSSSKPTRFVENTENTEIEYFIMCMDEE